MAGAAVRGCGVPPRPAAGPAGADPLEAGAFRGCAPRAERPEVGIDGEAHPWQVSQPAGTTVAGTHPAALPSAGRKGVAPRI
ncbi:hypothetical protein GCM10010470_26630 [Saccharopolyspora taberi]|uniref:Uncharacterized protein n=1 Tax=Saccharopolyspora taberi TaxID=60895 RepID=A0ABN3VC37_9PSEU